MRKFILGLAIALAEGRMDIQMKVYIVENHQILINYLLK